VEQGEKRVITSPDLTIPESKQPLYLIFHYWEITDGLTLKACKNDMDHCEDISQRGINRDDVRWKRGSIALTPDVKKVMLAGVNDGPNIGAVGLDGIGLADSPTGKDMCNPNEEAMVTTASSKL
jgi:hypothetical protein